MARKKTNKEDNNTSPKKKKTKKSDERATRELGNVNGTRKRKRNELFIEFDFSMIQVLLQLDHLRVDRRLTTKYSMRCYHLHRLSIN